MKHPKAPWTRLLILLLLLLPWTLLFLAPGRALTVGAVATFTF